MCGFGLSNSPERTKPAINDPEHCFSPMIMAVNIVAKEFREFFNEEPTNNLSAR